MQVDRVRKTFNRLLVTVFAAGIGAGFVGLWLPSTDTSEQRNLADFPTLTGGYAAIEKFPSAFQSFASDHFGFRNALLDLHSFISYRIFDKSGSDSVIVGRKGWLFYTDAKSVEDIERTEHFNQQEMDSWKASVVQRGDWLKSQGISYRFVIAPDKHSVYPEYLPQHIRGKGESRLQGLLSYLQGSPYVLDLAPALADAKKTAGTRLYFRTDTHWTSYGAYVGFRSLMDSLGGQYEATAMKVSPEAFHRGDPHLRDLAKMARINETEADEIYAGESNLPCKPDTAPWPASIADNKSYQGIDAVSCPGKNGTAIVYHDSFMELLGPYLATQFSKIIFVDGRPDDNLFVSLVKLEHPQVVIEERVERFMQLVPFHNLPDAIALNGHS